MDKIHNFTSTGLKFLSHPDNLFNYRQGEGNTVISTHISPTGLCNLNCSYCSVSKRDKHEQIEHAVIIDYVLKLMDRGLRAVILTGGGEPTMYAGLSGLIEWMKDQGLQIGLITNGCGGELTPGAWKALSWMRVSLNGQKLNVPVSELDEDCVVGCSYILTEETDTVSGFALAERQAKAIGAKYIRILPDCKPEDLTDWHRRIDVRIEHHPLWMHQNKNHRAPKANVCHQAYFRPYLSEVNGGTVFPCDSLVLNDCGEKFNEKYAICKAADVQDFLDRKIQMKSRPCDDCKGCVFADTVDALGGEMKHKDFV